MNINFRAQPEPLFTPRGSIKPGPSEKTSYLARRHNPHLRTLCHIKGLNDVPVCVVRDPGSVSGRLIMPEIEQGQSSMCTRALAERVFAGTPTMPNVQPARSKRKSFPQLKSDDMKEDLALLSNRTKNTSSLKRKGDLLRNIPEHSQNMPELDTCAFSPTLALRYRPEIMEDMNYTLTYLDHEIKILEKLRDILQTDSLSEIKQWLSKASLKDKEFVSNFIRSDMTTQDLLNYHQKYGHSGTDEARLNMQAMLKSPKAVGSTREEKQLRNVSQGSGASTGTRSDRERDKLLTRREEIIPACDTLPLEHSRSRSKIEERSPIFSEIPQTRSQLIYSRSYARQPRHLSGKNVPPKKL